MDEVLRLALKLPNGTGLGFHDDMPEYALQEIFELPETEVPAVN